MIKPEMPKQKPTVEKIFRRIEKYREEQKARERSFSYKLRTLNTLNEPITLETNWYGGLKTDSVKDSITKLSTNTKSHLQAHYDAFTATFKYFTDVYDLISMISTIESDLYSLLDENSSESLNKFEELTSNVDAFND